jgi:hypothetical protein
MDAFTAISSKPAASVTLEVTLSKDNPFYKPETDVKRFKIAGKEYLRKSELAASQKRRTPTSKCWRYGEPLIRLKDKVEVYYCYDCERANQTQQLPVLNGTAGGRQHMKGAHSRDPDTGLIDEPRKRPAAIFTLVERSDFDLFKTLLLRWFVFCQMALFMLENMYFRELVTYLNKGLGGLMPKASKTLRNWIMEAYENQKKQLAEELSFSRSKIHISFDIWTAGNWVGFLSVWAYWIDSSGDRQRRLLSFRRGFCSVVKADMGEKCAPQSLCAKGT